MIEFRISDFLAPKHLIYWRWKLWQSQYYTAGKQQALQWTLLSGLLDHCFHKVPYYRELFARQGLARSDFTSVADLALIPILSKEVLLDCSDDFKADNFHQFNPREISTSGTTGTPLTVYWDLGSNVLELTSMWRHFSWSGYRLGQPFLDLRSVLLQEPAGYKWNWKCRGLEMSSDRINADNIHEYAEIIRHYRIKLWRGHPSSIDALCRLLHDASIDDIKPSFLFTNSEALLENQRDFIESWAGVPVCDSYGLKEHNALICQCPEGGYHIAFEYGIIEIIREDGTPAMPGEEGRIIATSLHNRAFPLLRYDTGDYATQTDRVCSCGRTLPLIDKLTGRIDDRVLDSDGKWVSGLHFAFFFVTGIRKAQLVQERPDSLDVYIIPAQDYTPETGNIVRDNLKDKLGESVEIVIQVVEEVPFRPPGKFKFVVNRLEHHDDL